MLPGLDRHAASEIATTRLIVVASVTFIQIIEIAREAGVKKAMARFYFHLDECGTVTRDEDGVERPDLAAAREFALDAARDVMAAEVRTGHLCLSCIIEVADEQGATVLVVPFNEAVAVTGM